MSSSQTANADTTVPGYAYNDNSLRDASDWTRQLKEKRAYISYSSYNADNKNTGSEPWIKYGNQFRYTYLFGRFKCGACNGVAFASGVVGDA
jgi:hypothetical protein